MAWDFNLDLSKPRKGPATPGFTGDWRGGAAGQQAPQVTGASKPRGFVMEKEDSDEEAFPEEKSGEVQLIWDASKGQLVPKGAVASDTQEKVQEVAKSESKGEEAEADEGDAEGEEEEEGDDDVNVEAESRNAFLVDASTPELIKQAVAVGGPLADSTKDKWVMDQATQLYFKYDSASQKMYCWNTSQGCMYHWKERGKMTFLWASPNGAGSAPPAQVPGEGAAPSTEATTMPPVEEESTGDSVALWVTMIPPQVLSADFEDANAQAEEELELNGKAMGAVIGKGGKGIKEIEQATGVKSTTLNAREDAPGQKRLLLQGSKPQIAAAKSAIEQRIVALLGAKMAEKVQKHWNSQLLEKKRTESGSEAAKGGVRGLSEFALDYGLKAVMSRRLVKLDAQLQRYTIRHFKPMKAKPVNALRGYLAQLFKYPQRWRLEALYEDGELDGEICETIPLRGSAVIGRQVEDVQEQVIEVEVNTALGPKEASKIYGDVQDQHCRLHRMGNDFYIMALESQIGTLVDGQKIRQHDGPVPLRDGTTLGVGKYLFYCEVGSESFLQERRRKLLSGERFWKEGLASLQQAEEQAQDQKDQKDQPDEDEIEGDEEPLDVVYTDGSAQEETMLDKNEQNQEELAESQKRKREVACHAEEDSDKKMKAHVDDAPMPDAAEEVEELAEVEAPVDPA